MYTIGLTVTDDDTHADTSETMVVVYDPEAGFPTAGGFIDSPAGALTDDPDAAGRLHLQLNPKYHPRDEGPSPSGGKVSIRLKGSDFTLRSDHLEWLVVTRDDKTAVKGTERVNGEAGYGFVAYAYDDPDRFRLIVWPLTVADIPGESTVYDNRWRGHHDLDRSTPQSLARGSVRIHN